MTTTRHLAPAAAAVAILLSACGGSDSTDDTVTSVAVTAPETDPPEDFTEADTVVDTATDTGTDDSAVVDTAADDVADTIADGGDTPVDTADPIDDGGDEPVEGTVATGETGETGETGAAAGMATATLSEWMIDAPTDYAAGEVTFTAVNDGSFPHEFVVIEGESYETLPLEEGGSVIEADLPTGALLGRTDRIGDGSSEDLTVTLSPGNYVLVCNLGGGDNSHAGQGQRLDITVS